jgi:hypothetical protein
LIWPKFSADRELNRHGDRRRALIAFAGLLIHPEQVLQRNQNPRRPLDGPVETSRSWRSGAGSAANIHLKEFSMRLSQVLVRSAMLLALASFRSAFAVPDLPPVDVYNQVDATLGWRIIYANGNDLYQFSAGGGASNADGTVVVASVMTPAPLPSLSASGGFSTSVYGQIDVSAAMDYFFAISGPTASVPVTVAARGHSTKTNQSGNVFPGIVASALMINPASSPIETNNIVLLSSGIPFGGANLGIGLPTGDQSDAFDSSASYLFATDTVYRVRLSGGIKATSWGPGSITVETFVDPVLTIDQPGYTLFLSAGVGNGVVPVPEPAPAVVLALGLLLIGSATPARRASGLSRP